MDDIFIKAMSLFSVYPDNNNNNNNNNNILL